MRSTHLLTISSQAALSEADCTASRSDRLMHCKSFLTTSIHLRRGRPRGRRMSVVLIDIRRAWKEDDSSPSLTTWPNHSSLRCLQTWDMLLAFYGFLRCSEFTGETRSADARLADGNMQLFLPKSKTDPLGSGVTVFVGRATQPYCPVAAMTAYLLTTRHHPSTGPLFVLSDGQKLTRAAFTTTVRSLLAASGVPNLHLYSGHSFRIGAATTAAMAGVPDSLIRAAGRWKSDVCLRYMRMPASLKYSVSSQLAKVSHLV